MTFAVDAEIYDRHVGRYGEDLGRALVAAVGLSPRMRVLDVGAGTGKLTGVLAGAVGEENVAAVDPSEPFAATLSERFLEAEVHHAAAEDLPFDDGTFDAVFAQLVVNFLADAQKGVGEMRRVTREGGVVAACVWDYPEGMNLLRAFWEAATATDSSAASRDERTSMPFDQKGELAALWREVGLLDVEDGEILVSAEYESFDDLWEPFTTGVAPSGAHVASLATPARERLRDRYWKLLGSPDGPFQLQARAWYAIGRK
jgi:SAM-dependent methyltransferase